MAPETAYVSTDQNKRGVTSRRPYDVIGIAIVDSIISGSSANRISDLALSKSFI